MICLYGETRLSSFTLIIYTCICIPFLQIIQASVRVFTFLLDDPHRQPESCGFEENPEWELDLPVSKYRDSKFGKRNGGEEMDGEEMCSICLTEFDNEDLVNKLLRCGHVFHMECMEKWLERCQFTCPLCRSSVLRIRSSSPCRTSTSSPFCIDLTHAHDS